MHRIADGRVSTLNWSQQRMIDYVADQLLKKGRHVTPSDAATELGWPLYKSQRVLAELEELGLVQHHTAAAPN